MKHFFDFFRIISANLYLFSTLCIIYLKNKKRMLKRRLFLDSWVCIICQERGEAAFNIKIESVKDPRSVACRKDTFVMIDTFILCPWQSCLTTAPITVWWRWRTSCCCWEERTSGTPMVLLHTCLLFLEKQQHLSAFMKPDSYDKISCVNTSWTAHSCLLKTPTDTFT